MTLREQILASPETLSDLMWAAEQRFREAEELFVAGRFAGAVYLLGLASEMWLKTACFRFRRERLSRRVADLLAPARLWMRSHPPAVDHESYHSLRFWAEYLARLRSRHGIPMPAALLGQLRHHVIHRLYDDWRIDVRYSALPISQLHAWRVYNDTVWLRDSWEQLWR